MLIIFKFDWNLVTKPPPYHISILWIISITVLILWTIWHFFIYPELKVASNVKQVTSSGKKNLLLGAAIQEIDKNKENHQNGQMVESAELKNLKIAKSKKNI